MELISSMDCENNGVRNYVKKEETRISHERLHYGFYRRSVHSFEIHMKTPMKYQKPKVLQPYNERNCYKFGKQ